MSRGGNAHEQCVTRCAVSRVITSRFPPGIPGITMLGSQLTKLARLSYNRKVDFCCVSLGCWNLCKAIQLGSCNQTLSFIAGFYALPLISPISQSPRAHTQNFRRHPQHLHTSLSILMNFLPYPCSLAISPYKFYQK